MYEILKKKYGQNFLVDKNISNKITNLITKNELSIIEIGPGDGRLTDHIIKFKPKELLLIEIDEDLIPTLNIKYSNYKNIKIFNDNFLDFNIEKKFDLILSNLPYNISSPILVKICLLSKLPQSLIFMFQKEFADRLLDKKLNSLNSLVKCFYEIKKNFKVSKNCFRPIPKVDSKVLFFEKKSKTLLNKNELNNFISFKRQLFSQKRKSLKNILKKYKLDSEEFNLSLRPEELELKSLIKIFRKTNL